ncbi:MAG: LysR family transcriptional regulator [Myxococcota bacterium]
MDRLEAMRAFVRLVELQSFTKVGRELRVKQSTVSKWVAALESQFGVTLVERTSRTQRVTESGSIFYERAKEILAAYAATEAELQRDSPELRGRLRVSLPTVFGRLFVVPHLPAFLQAHDAIEVEIVLDDRYVRLVEDGFDVAIRVGVPVDSSLRCRTLARTPRRLVAAPSYLKERGAPVSPPDLQGHSCLFHTGLRTGEVWTFQREGKDVRAPVQGRFGANNSEAIVTMACAGMGIALLASWLVDDHLRAGALVPVLPDYDLPSAPVQAITPPSRVVHPRVRGFLDFIGERIETSLPALFEG